MPSRGKCRHRCGLRRALRNKSGPGKPPRRDDDGNENGTDD